MKYDNLTGEEIALLHETIYDNPYIIHEPTPKQIEAILCPAREMFFGGAVGGGKTDYLLMLGLQYMHLAKYNVLILRRNYTDMTKPDSIIPRAQEWLEQTDAHYRGVDKHYKFPKGGTLVFGHMESEKDKYKYRSDQYHTILFEEVTDFTKSQYIYMFTRLRKPEDSGETYDIPLRMRATGNPDGPGMGWTKSRFVKPGKEGRPFIPSRLEDNPYIDDSYLESLAELDPLTYERMRWGNWDAKQEGKFFKTDKVEIVDSWPRSFASDIVRRWDLAATEEPDKYEDDSGSNNPDYTVGLKGAYVDGTYYILHMERGRWGPDDTDRKILSTAKSDGLGVRIVVEQEPGSAGVRDARHLRKMLSKYAFSAKPSTGDKLIRARPAASQMNQGRIKLMRGSWNDDFLDDLVRITPENYKTKGVKCDVMDTLSGLVQDIDVPEPVPFETFGGISERQDEEFNNL